MLTGGKPKRSDQAAPFDVSLTRDLIRKRPAGAVLEESNPSFQFVQAMEKIMTSAETRKKKCPKLAMVPVGSMASDVFSRLINP